MASSLSASEMVKPGREYRIVLFLKKYQNREEFVLMGNKKVTLVYDKKVADQLKAKRNLASLVFTSTDGQKLKLSNFQKTPEFGGKAESTTRIEEAEIISIRKQMSEIRQQTGEPCVPIKIGNKVYQCCNIEKTAGTPKSDFHFLDINGKPIVWLSHKDGSKASDFQQWGGVSKIVPNVHNHPETKEFYKDVIESFPEGFPPKTNVVKEIGDPLLKKKAVYGDDYRPGSTRFGENNVTMILQGPVTLKKVGNGQNVYYKIEANHANKNGETMKGDYEPIFDGSYRQGRGQPVNNARLGIWPKVIEKRKGTIKFPKK